MKRIILLLLCATLCHATSVTIAESTYADASGRLATGTITISWPSFSNGVSNIAAGSTTVTVTAGVLSVSLVANDTADPPFNYTASFRLQAASYSEQWKVPTVAGPLTIQQVKWSSNSPVTVGLDQLRRSGYTAGDIAYYDGILWKRLARGTNGQVLSIDTSLSGYLKWAAASGGGTWGSITGTLSAQTDLAAALAAKLAISNNLSDLGSAATARTNLGLGTAALSAASAFAATAHVHAAADVTSGVFNIARLASGTPNGAKFVRDDGTLAIPAGTGLSLTDFSATTPVQYNNSTGVFSMLIASTSVSGYLTSTDWNTFNGKQAALGFTPPANTLTISTTSPLTGGGSLAANRTFACATCTTNASANTSTAVMLGGGLQAIVPSGCTVDGSNQMTCPGGFNTSGTGVLQLPGSTSGVVTIAPPAVAGTPTLTLPIVSGNFAINTTGSGTATATPASDVIPKSGTDSRLAPGFLQPVAPYGGIPFSGMAFKSVLVSNAPVATTDAYTAPGGKRAYVAQMAYHNSAGAGPVVISGAVKVSGTYYRVTTDISVSLNTGNSRDVNWVLEPGETIAVVANAVGANIWFRVIEYDSTIPLYTARLLAVAVGDNTLYTVPVGKSAQLLANPGVGVGTPGLVLFGNFSGGSRAAKLFVVPSAGASGLGNQIFLNAAAANGTIAQISNLPQMTAGDFLVFNTDANTATQIVWTTVMEK